MPLILFPRRCLSSRTGPLPPGDVSDWAKQAQLVALVGNCLVLKWREVRLQVRGWGVKRITPAVFECFKNGQRDYFLKAARRIVCHCRELRTRGSGCLAQQSAPWGWRTSWGTDQVNVVV
jgi:hypothetical protein